MGWEKEAGKTLGSNLHIKKETKMPVANLDNKTTEDDEEDTGWKELAVSLLISGKVRK